MRYLIALDLDETLLNSKKEISSRTKIALQKCKNDGHILVISSTRGYGSCKAIAKMISADYVCCQSGNMIVDNVGNIVYKNGFSGAVIKDMLDLFSQYTKNIVIDSDSELYGGIDDEFARSWGVCHCSIEDLYTKTGYKVCVHFEPKYKGVIESYCKQHNYNCMVMRTDPFLLITPANSDKYYALERLLKILKMGPDHLVVFGDDSSDKLSIKMAGFGVAVSNARPEVLDVAKYVTESNDEDGVASFLEKM